MHHKSELSSILRTLLAFPRVPHYTYKALGGPPDAIRLLVIQPAPFRISPIQCQVIESTWSQSTHGNEKTKGYVALSYTWGDITQKACIEIEGRQLHITENLEQALRQLQTQRSTVTIWADSLCINQQDIEERNLHVSHMREIYSAARQITIFLGEATSGSDALMHAILATTILIIKSRTINEIIRTIVQASVISTAELQNEALRILCRAYWTRIWIFQEIVVSANPRVQCSDISIPWDIFCQSLIALLKHDTKTKYWGSGYSNKPRQRLEDIHWERRMYRSAGGHVEPSPSWDMERRSKHTSEGKLGLLDLLVSKRGSEATDARDKIYAESGIASKPDDGRDYISESPALVYMDTVDYLLSQNESSYEVLSHAGLPTETPNETVATKTTPLPSWVPDWRHPSSHKTRISDWVNITPSPSTSKKKPAHHYPPSHSILAIPARIHHLIASLQPDLSSLSPAADTIGRMIWSASILSKLSEGISPCLGSVREMLARSHPLTYRRKVAELDGRGGTWCLVPPNARVGDVIVLFGECGVPFVVRSWNRSGDERMVKVGLWGRIQRWMLGEESVRVTREEEGKMLDTEILMAMRNKNPMDGYKEVVHFQLVGECYVDGLMDFRKRDKREENRSEVVIALHWFSHA